MHVSSNAFIIMLLECVLILTMLLVIDWLCGLIKEKNMLLSKYKSDIDWLNSRLYYAKKRLVDLNEECDHVMTCYANLSNEYIELKRKLKIINKDLLTREADDNRIVLYDIRLV